MEAISAAQNEARDFFEALKTDDGRLITEMRMTDGYINATKMCESAGKLWGGYFRNKTTEAATVDPISGQTYSLGYVHGYNKRATSVAIRVPKGLLATV